MKTKRYARKFDVVFAEHRTGRTKLRFNCCSLQWLQNYFINLTDVSGLYNKNPKEHKDAKFIPKFLKDFKK